jgi:hypothetical protein
LASASANALESFGETRTSAQLSPVPAAARSFSAGAIAGEAATSSTVRSAHRPLPRAELIHVTLAQAAMTTTSSAPSQSTGGRTDRTSIMAAPRSARSLTAPREAGGGFRTRLISVRGGNASGSEILEFYAPDPVHRIPRSSRARRIGVGKAAFELVSG